MADASNASSANAPTAPSPQQVAMENAFSTLPEAQREVLRLKFKRGWGYPQIAEATGQSLSTVEYLVHHGVKNLDTKLNRSE